jgi:hypothetical protein
MAKKPKRSRDSNQHAKLFVDITSGQVNEVGQPPRSAAAKLGAKGDRARAESISRERRVEIAKKVLLNDGWISSSSGIPGLPPNEARQQRDCEAVGAATISVD